MKMSVNNKLARLRWLAPMVLFPVMLSAGTGQPRPHARAGSATEATGAAPALDTSVAVAPELASASGGASRAPVPFCPAGEKRVCSLGPPPVCWCE
jgi:hypothetical protein